MLEIKSEKVDLDEIVFDHFLYILIMFTVLIMVHFSSIKMEPSTIALELVEKKEGSHMQLNEDTAQHANNGKGGLLSCLLILGKFLSPMFSHSTSFFNSKVVLDKT